MTYGMGKFHFYIEREQTIEQSDLAIIVLRRESVFENFLAAVPQQPKPH